MRQLATASMILAAIGWVPAAASDYEAALQDWEAVLQQFVDEQGRIDFTALSAAHAELDRFVEFIARFSPASHPDLFPSRADQLAYHLNAYNALAMQGVIDRGIPEDFDGFFKRLSFFKLRKIVVGGEKTSLYDYENGVIRPLGEARVHFALNCMVRGCPRLPREPFRAGSLERQLQDATVEFFSREKNIRVDAYKGTVHLSWILDYYMDDFIGADKRRALIGYVNRYRAVPVPEDYRVKFMPYDWTVNRQPH
ncbi:MAG: DUF547 domain-containing protein [Xanthomonadales bacterium]|nr:DUF547 domain-containing protein [Xanthomonadales bacterium]